MRHDINLAQLSRREIGYIIGFYIGDGSIFIKQSLGVYRLRIFTWIKEIKIQQKLEFLLLKIFKKVRRYKERDNTLIFEIHSKDFLSFIQKTADKNGLKIKPSQEFKKGFIEGLIDSDGYVQRNYAEITTSNKKLRSQIVRTLRGFEIEPNIRNYISPLSKRKGWRIGFSLNSNQFFPVKWVVSL